MAKTGTTSDDCDRWFCAGTPHYVAAVWLGYDIKQSLNQEVEKKFCKASGNLAGPNCGATGTGWYKETALPDTCTWCTASSSDDDKSASKVVEGVTNAISEAINGLLGN